MGGWFLINAMETVFLKDNFKAHRIAKNVFNAKT